MDAYHHLQQEPQCNLQNASSWVVLRIENQKTVVLHSSSSHWSLS